jgi:rubrerythrin
MYPEYMKQAREAGDKAAVRVFNFAKSAEGDHAKFYKEASENLDSWKKGKKDFYVCGECGRTVTEKPTGKCPVCFEPASIYKMVS